MRRLTIVLAAALLAACGKEPTREELAARAAKEYYTMLNDSLYDDFVMAHYDAGALPEAFRRQLATNAKQFLHTQKSQHKGIDSISIVKARHDSTRNRTDVFLKLCYADSTKEEIVVPMKEKDGKWFLAFL